jgi:hypothetical protein
MKSAVLLLLLSICLAHAQTRTLWHTDLQEAIAVAKKEKTTVLSLRLLGKFGADESCANSRFFIETLYSRPATEKFLSEKFVLHWESGAPVPMVTIDFGNGKVIKTPFSGNSAHLLIDAIPGLYDEEHFWRALQPAL